MALTDEYSAKMMQIMRESHCSSESLRHLQIRPLMITRCSPRLGGPQFDGTPDALQTSNGAVGLIQSPLRLTAGQNLRCCFRFTNY